MTRHFIKEALRPKQRRGSPDAGPPVRDPHPCWWHTAHKSPRNTKWGVGCRLPAQGLGGLADEACANGPCLLPLLLHSASGQGEQSAQEEWPSRAPHLYQPALKGQQGAAWGWRRLSTRPQAGQRTADSGRRLTNRRGTAWLRRTVTPITGQCPYTSAGLKRHVFSVFNCIWNYSKSTTKYHLCANTHFVPFSRTQFLIRIWPWFC